MLRNSPTEMSRIKTAVIIIVIVALVAAVAAGVWYYKNKFYVPDKNGMVYYDSDINKQGDD